MGFYGNITNTSRTQFTFDKTYANRVEMDAHANIDGIYVGRYVLVEYDNHMSADWCTDVYLKEGVFYTSPNMELNSKVLYGVGNIVKNKYLRVPAVYIDPETKKEVIHNFDATAENKYKDVLYRIQETEVGEVPNVELILITDEKNKYVENYQIDMKQYGEGRGYDSTVWQKVYTDNHERYVMIAELNTVVPTFGVSADAPTLSPITPHFDADSSNVYYKVHWQPAWGLRIKSAAKTITSPLIDDDGKSIGGTVQLSNPMTHSLLSDENTAWYRTVYNPSTGAFKDLYYSAAVNPDTLETSGNWDKRAGVNNTETVPAAIYYNKAGFNPEYITYSDSDLPVGMNPIVDKIALEPTGKSGYAYNKHDGTAGKEAQIDTQELSILLPSIGDTMAKIWDLVYGNEKLTGSRNRNLNIKWSNGSITPDLSGLRLVTKSDKGYGYEPGQVSTIAGAINSVHDLMGMIIREYDGSTLDENYIYYKPDEGVYGRRAKKYTYKPFALTNNTFNKESRFVEVELAGTISGFYADYASSNPLNPNTSKAYPNYIYDSALSNNGKQSYKTIKVNEEEKITGAELADGVFEPYKFFVLKKNHEVTVGNASQSTTVKTDSYQVSLDTSFQANTSYLKVEYTDLPSNTRFYQPGLYYRPEFEGPTVDHTYKNYESGELFELDDNGRYVRPTSYVVGKGYYMMKTPIVPYTGTVLDSEQYFEVSSYVEDGDNVLVERSYYEEDRNVNADNFLSRPRYVTEDKVVYTLASQFIAGTTYYNKITTWEEQTDTISPSALQEVKLIVYNEGRTVYHRIPKGGGGANGLEEFIKINNNLIGYYKENLVHIAITPISSVYGPNLYYYLEDSGTLKGSWIFDSNSTPTLDRDYYLPTALVAESPVEIGDKYEPFKFYHKVNNDFILDATSEPTENRTYYTKKGLYVLEDTTGLYPKGTEWSISVETVPTNITLAEKEESWGFEELPGFARNMNTIHGLILKLNNLLESGDADVRNYDTAQGLMNKLRDIILQFGELKPNQIMATDSYGRVLTKSINGDNQWINVENNTTEINISHNSMLDNSKQSSQLLIKSLNNNITPSFGSKIELLTTTLAQDAAGHLVQNAMSNGDKQSITLPSMTFTEVVGKNGGNVIVSVNATDLNTTNAKFESNRQWVGSLQLDASFNAIDNDKTDIVPTDTISTAFGKVNAALNDVYKGAKTYTDGKIKTLEEKHADDVYLIADQKLVNFKYKDETATSTNGKLGISSARTINEAFANINDYVSKIKLDDYNTIHNIIDPNNGNTSTLDERLGAKLSLERKNLTLSANYNWSAIGYNKGTYVVISTEGEGVYSYNGKDWNTMTIDPNRTVAYDSLAYGISHFIAYQKGSTYAMYSGNGIAWREASSLINALEDGDVIDAIVALEGIFVAIVLGPRGRRFLKAINAYDEWNEYAIQEGSSSPIVSTVCYTSNTVSICMFSVTSGNIYTFTNTMASGSRYKKENVYYTLACNENNVIMGVSTNSIIVSTDGGDKWTEHSSSGLPSSWDYFRGSGSDFTMISHPSVGTISYTNNNVEVGSFVSSRGGGFYSITNYVNDRYITVAPNSDYIRYGSYPLSLTNLNDPALYQNETNVTSSVEDMLGFKYSLEETKLPGEYWIDGEPIYRKVIQAGSFTPSSTNKGLCLTPLNINCLLGYVISLRGYGVRSGAALDVFPYAHSTDTNNIALGINGYNTDSPSIFLQFSASATNRAYTDIYFIIEYTKFI